MSEKYKCVSDKRCGTAQGARIIELRSFTLDKVKLSLFNTGEISAMSEDMWDPVYTEIGNIIFASHSSHSNGKYIVQTATGRREKSAYKPHAYKTSSVLPKLKF